MLTTLCVGMTRVTTLFQLISQAVLLGPFRLISYFYLVKFHKIIKDLHVATHKSK